MRYEGRKLNEPCGKFSLNMVEPIRHMTYELVVKSNRSNFVLFEYQGVSEQLKKEDVSVME